MALHGKSLPSAWWSRQTAPCHLQNMGVVSLAKHTVENCGCYVFQFYNATIGSIDRSMIGCFVPYWCSSLEALPRCIAQPFIPRVRCPLLSGKGISYANAGLYSRLTNASHFSWVMAMIVLLRILEIYISCSYGGQIWNKLQLYVA